MAKPRIADKRIKPGRIHAVLTTLGREIAQELIPAGTALPPEPDLERRFGVGRGVIREAVKTLAAKGMVSVRPRHGTHVLPRSEWSLLDRDVLSWLVGEGEPDRDLLLAIQEVRSIIEPAAAALAAERATKNDRWRINAALAEMETAQDQASTLAADKAFHLAILDATHNPVLQGFRGTIDTILSTVFVVAIGSADWFRDNLPNHAAAARAISCRKTPPVLTGKSSNFWKSGDATLILIDSDAELARARMLVDRLWDSNDPTDIVRLEAQARLIAAYEERKWPRRSPSLAEMIRHLMDQHGLTRADMVPILGTPSRVSEVLSGKKGLSMAMVQRLRARFRVPADLLLPPPKKPSSARTTKRAAA